MEEGEIGKRLQHGLALRAKYTPTDQRPMIDLPADLDIRWHQGIIQISKKGETENLCPSPTLSEFYDDMDSFFTIRTEGPVVSYTYCRLAMMKSKYDTYTMLNHEAELEEQRSTPHRDFYNIRKVDTHIHHSAAMNCKHLLRFMKNKLKKHKDDVVLREDGKDITLKEVFNRLNIEPIDLSIDKLQIWTDRTCMHRFDRFNNLYSPMGQSLLRTVFLKTDNDMGGQYLAEITQELLDDLAETKYVHTEWRLSIYGRNISEWDTLARWVFGRSKAGVRTRKPLISKQNRWMIQIPRLYSAYKKAGQIDNFQDMLENIFTPMIEATLGIGDHEDLKSFLAEISGFDTVDDESKSKSPVDRLFSSRERQPDTWDLYDNPSYKYYSFFIHTNLRIINRLRAARGLNQFQFRPHCGEAGEIHHLDCAFLLADNIQHGINLRKSPSLQYLYYLARVGLSVSPISNNQLFVPLEKNPFPQFFALGMLVTLSTDDPLMFHQTREALTEEYSVAKQVWRLGTVDLCEIAHNSVLISGFPASVKEQWLGKTNSGHMDVNLSNVPACRHAFRQEVYRDEYAVIQSLVDEMPIMKPFDLQSTPLSRKSRTYNCMVSTNLDVDQAGADENSESSSEESVHRAGSPRSRGISMSFMASARDLSSATLAQNAKLDRLLAQSNIDHGEIEGENARIRALKDGRVHYSDDKLVFSKIAVIIPWIIASFLIGYITAKRVR